MVEVRVRQHPNFVRRDYDIYSDHKISFAVAALGGEVIIDTIDGQISYEVKAGTQTNTKIRLRGKGVPSLRNTNIQAHEQHGRRGGLERLLR